MESIRLLGITIILGLFLGVFVWGLGSFFPKPRIIKYIPIIFPLGASIIFIYKSTQPSEGFGQIGYVIVSVISIGTFIISMSSALLLELVQYIKRRKRKKL